MRHLLASLVVLFVGAGFAAASDVEVKGPHICCGQCVKVVGKILEKVDGVSDVRADSKTKTVTYKAKDSKAAKAGFDALRAGGFFGKATEDGKEIKLNEAYTKDAANKVDSVTVTNVHACCGMCHTAIKNLFKGSTVTIDGTGPQRTITIQGANLTQMSVLEALRKEGFNGGFGK